MYNLFGRIKMINHDDLKNIAKNVKLVAFDVDGVMTDGSLTFL